MNRKHEQTTASQGAITPPEDLSQADYRALAEFRSELRRFLRFSEEVTLAAGLEPQQQQLLLAIKGTPDGATVTITDLAERLQLKHHSAVELINRAEERGLVQRARDEIDRRKVIIHLTPQGEDALRQLALYHRAELRQAGPRLIQALKRIIEDTRLSRPGQVGPIAAEPLRLEDYIQQ